MTISTTTSRISYNGNGVTTVFSFPYRFLADGDLVVLAVSAAGVETTKTLTTDYTLTGAGDDAGGSVTMLVAPASGTKLTIYRDTDVTQEVDYISGDPFPAETHERALDRLTMIAQEIGSDADRSIKVPVGDSSSLTTTLPAAANRLDKFLVFDLTTGATEVSDVTHTQVASAVAAAYAAGSTADAVTYLALFAGTVSRSVQAWMRELVLISDRGAVGDGSTDDQPAIQALITAQEAAGDTVYFHVPVGKTFLVGSTLTITKRPVITGGGKIKCTGDFPIFTLNINTTTVNFWRIDCEFEGPVSTNTSSCAILITGDATALFQHGQAKIVTNGFNAAVKDTKTARTTGAGLEAMCNWNQWDVDILSPATYGFWNTQGSGTGNIVRGVINPRLNTGACVFYDGSGCVVGDVIVSGHWGCAVAGGVGVKIGASTVYRAQWDLSKIQFDANCDTPISMSGTGSTPYRNWNVSGNNLGGATALGAGLQPLYSSIVDDRDVSRWYAGNYKNTATIGALTTNVFTIDFATYGAGTFEVFTAGLLGGVGSRYGFAEFDIIEAGGSLTVTAARAARGIFVISTTTSGTTCTVRWAATSTGAGTDTNSTIRGIGHGFKISRA